MALLGKVRSKVGSGLKRVKAGLKGLSPEARPAGHPPPTEGPAPKPNAGKAPPPKAAAPSSEAAGGGEAPGGGEFWYLQGEHDGWEETNPGEKWKADIEE